MFFITSVTEVFVSMHMSYTHHYQTSMLFWFIYILFWAFFTSLSFVTPAHTIISLSLQVYRDKAIRNLGSYIKIAEILYGAALCPLVILAHAIVIIGL